MRYVRAMSRRKYAFLVNLWFEAEDEEAPGARRWRGSVERLSTRQRLYFNDLTELVAFLATSTGRRDAN